MTTMSEPKSSSAPGATGHSISFSPTAQNHADAKKVVQVVYVLGAVLLSYLVFSGANRVAGFLDLESRIRSIEIILRVASIVAGLGFFMILQTSVAANEYMTEVAVEFLTKISWPSQRDTMAATGVVIVAILIASFFLGLFDWACSALLRLII